MAGSMFGEGAFLVERVANRVHRMALDTPRARLGSELRFRAAREQHPAPVLRDPGDQVLLDQLRQEGIALTTVADLGLAEVFEAAQPLVEEVLALPTPPDLPATHLGPESLSTVPEVFCWGLGQRILDLLEAYFEVPVAYHGVYVRRDMAVQQSGASNLWHLDMEDRKVIKVVVYLTDVADGDGSFQYVPLDDSLELIRRLGPVYRLGTDGEMATLVPEDRWRTAKGTAGTVLISDTALLFHKGRRPQRRDRVTLFYDYTSRQPTHPFYCKSALPRTYLERLTAFADPRARDAVFWRPRLKEFDPRKHE